MRPIRVSAAVMSASAAWIRAARAAAAARARAASPVARAPAARAARSGAGRLAASLLRLGEGRRRLGDGEVAGEEQRRARAAPPGGGARCRGSRLSDERRLRRPTPVLQGGESRSHSIPYPSR